MDLVFMEKEEVIDKKILDLYFNDNSKGNKKGGKNSLIRSVTRAATVNDIIDESIEYNSSGDENSETEKLE